MFPEPTRGVELSWNTLCILLSSHPPVFLVGLKHGRKNIQMQKDKLDVSL